MATPNTLCSSNDLLDLHSYYIMFCPTKDAPQLFPLINLDCKRKLPHLRWHAFPTDLATNTVTLTLCPHKIKRFKRWLNSTKFRSHRRRSKIHLNNDTLHARWTNEWKQIKSYGLVIQNADDLAFLAH